MGLVSYEVCAHLINFVKIHLITLTEFADNKAIFFIGPALRLTFMQIILTWREKKLWYEKYLKYYQRIRTSSVV